MVQAKHLEAYCLADPADPAMHVLHAQHLQMRCDVLAVQNLGESWWCRRLSIQPAVALKKMTPLPLRDILLQLSSNALHPGLQSLFCQLWIAIRQKAQNIKPHM